ncbi:helix-turn-helix transcriptional regulator [bacterium]|nr:helix-turn-helix transcriptional regulator [bacterium]
MAKIINYIKTYRLKNELTQESLAKLAGVSRQSINSIERNRYVPSLPLALTFSLIFQCQTDDLFKIEEDYHG